MHEGRIANGEDTTLDLQVAGINVRYIQLRLMLCDYLIVSLPTYCCHKVECLALKLHIHVTHGQRRVRKLLAGHLLFASLHARAELARMASSSGQVT